LVNAVDEISRFYSEMTPITVGYGARDKDFEEMPNSLRITLGKALHNWLLKDAFVFMEKNFDAVAGETIGNLVDKLLREGAKDVCIITMFKKEQT
jgi:pyridinium-3,5-bisthiocarboxylic acid mononucleotide nickel chelatase